MTRITKWLIPLVVLGIAAGAATLLHRELQNYDYRAVIEALRAIPLSRLLIALGLTGLSYTVLIGYDCLAFRHIGRSPGYPRTALAAFIAYVLTYNLGLSIFSGAAVRFRMYGAWGFSAGEITRIVAFVSFTFWLGILALTGLALIDGDVKLPPQFAVSETFVQLLGVLMLGVVAAYVVLCAKRRAPLNVFRWRLPLPSWQVALQQVGIGSIDVVLAGAVAWVLMPSAWSSFPDFFGTYLVGMTAGVISHVPGGLGVMETIIVYARPQSLTAPMVLGSMLACRAIYYLLPLSIGVLLLAAYELRRQPFWRGFSTHSVASKASEMPAPPP